MSSIFVWNQGELPIRITRVNKQALSKFYLSWESLNDLQFKTWCKASTAATTISVGQCSPDKGLKFLKIQNRVKFPNNQKG